MGILNIFQVFSLLLPKLDFADLKEKVNNKNVALSKLFKQGSDSSGPDERQKKAEEIADLYTDKETPILLLPKGRRIEGKENIAKFWKTVMDNGVTNVTFKFNEFYVSGRGKALLMAEEMICVIGTCTFEGQVAGGGFKNCDFLYLEKWDHEKHCEPARCITCMTGCQLLNNIIDIYK